MTGPGARSRLGLLLITKAPVAGLAKRRLAAQIGPEPAADVARVLLANSLAACLAFAPRVRGLYQGPLAALPRRRGLTWAPSPADDPVPAVLAAFGDLEDEFERLVAVPSDVPGLTPAYLAAAADALERCDVVLGPSRDGGLVLLGAARRLPGELGGLRASSGRLHDDVLATCTGRGLTVGSLAPLTDLDTWSSISGAVDAGELREGSALHARLVRAAGVARAPASGRGAADQLDDVRPRAARQRPARHPTPR